MRILTLYLSLLISFPAFAQMKTATLVVSSNDVLQLQCSTDSRNGSTTRYGNVGLLTPSFKTSFFSQSSDGEQICDALGALMPPTSSKKPVYLRVRPIPGTNSLWIESVQPQP